MSCNHEMNTSGSVRNLTISLFSGDVIRSRVCLNETQWKLKGCVLIINPSFAFINISDICFALGDIFFLNKWSKKRDVF